MRTVEAGFLSSLLGGQAYAEGASGDAAPEVIHNSQNIALLQANVSSVSLLEKSAKKEDKKDAEKIIDPGSSISIVSENSLLPSTGPMGVSDGKGSPDYSAGETSVYVVRSGDSISQIAEMFGVSVNTIIWANDLQKGQNLAAGDTLLILPVSGVKHTVTKGQTLQGIAKLYKVEVSEIVDFNDVGEGGQLAIGDELIIPDGVIPEASKSTSPKKSTKSSPYSASTLKNLVGYFINPVPDLKRKSQGLHGPGKRGVDLAAPTGTKIYASAPGTVILARNGYNGGYGNMVIVQHPNGTKTLYAHASTLATKTGAKVDRGQIIAYVGSTGRSTGPHLHFEVFNAKNPGSDWSWAK